MRGLQCGFDEKHACICENTDLVAVDAAPAGHDRVAIKRFEFVKIALIDQPSHDFAVVGRHLGVAADESINLFDRVGGRTGRFGRLAGLGFFAKMADNFARDGQSVGVIFGQMVCHTGDGRMHLAATQFFGFDLFAGCGKGQFRSAQIHKALTAHDHHFVTERGDIGTTRGAGPHDHGDLRHTIAGHANLLVKDGPELAFVGKDVFLIRQEGAAGVHEGDNGQTVLPCDLLRPHMFARCHAEIGAALYRGIIGDDHALTALDHTDPGDDARARRHAIVFVQPGKFSEFQKWCARVDQAFNPFPRQDLALLHMPVARLFGAADTLQQPQRVQIGEFFTVVCVICPKVVGPGIKQGFHFGHGRFGYSLRTKATLAAPGFSKVSAATR